MRHFLLISVALTALITLQSCMSVDTTLTVIQPGGLALYNADGTLVQIPQGDHPIQLSVAQDSSSPSTLTLKDINVKFEITLPGAEKIANITTPLTVHATELKQPVEMTFQRDADSSTDHFTMAFMSTDGNQILATSRFDNPKGDIPAFDESNQTFLMSFQKVKYSQRAVLIPIDGALIEPMNSIVNHAAMILLAPWVYARYSTVEWFISSGEMSDEDTNKKVQHAVSSSPVIDLFAFNHAGEDGETLAAAENLGAKKNQIRFVYTEGCGSADYLNDIITNYNAAVAVGHRDTSASPFYAFGLVHAWTYGESANSAMMTGWISGSAWIDLAAILTLDQLWRLPIDWDSREDMLKQSEPAIMWTAEMTPEKLNIETSAVLSRNTPESNTAYRSFAATYGKDIESIPLQSSFGATTH